MARARNIKPGFFTNDVLADIPALGRLLFVGLWTIADRAGRLEDRVKKIKAKVLPYDDCDVDCLLSILDARGFIHRYVVGDNHYIQICKWDAHQNPHVKENDSLIPAPDQHQMMTVPGMMPVPELTGTGPADSLNLIPDPLNRIPDSLNPEAVTALPHQDIADKKTAAAKPKKSGKFDECPAEFETAWQAYPRRPGASKKEAWQAWLARRRDGVDATLMVDGVKRYAAYIAASGQAPRFVKHAATFFGPYEHYKADWSMPEHQAPPASSKHTGFANTNYTQGIAQDGSF